MARKPQPPAREFTLQSFGGLYTIADPRVLPAGASPLCYDVDFTIQGLTIRPGLTVPVTLPSGTAAYQWIKGMSLPGGLQQTLFQDSTGNLFYENLAIPGILTKFYSGILNSARALSATFPNAEFIGLSNLVSGVDQPRQWNGTNLDRISQCGPGAGPSVPPQAPPATYGVQSIIQPYSTHVIDSAVWGAYIDEYNAPPSANSLWIMGGPGVGAIWLGDVKIGDNIYISGMGTLEGQNPNGTYTVAGTGFFTDATGTKPYILVTTSIAVSDFARGTAGGTYRKTSAILTITNPIPALSATIGGNLTISGASPNQWNGVWEIQFTPTLGQLLVQATALLSNVATYTYAIASGEAPGWQADNAYVLGCTIVDQYGHVWQVTVPGTSGGSIPAFPASPAPGATILDGTSPTQVTWTYQAGAVVTVTVYGTSNGNGIFNVANATITSATSTTFTTTIPSPNFAAAGEAGNAISGSANVIVIDPAQKTLNTGSPGTDPIYGNASAGGLVVPPATGNVAAGQRYAICMFLSRSGNITPASPPVSFYTTGQSTQLTFQNIPIGPPNVIARIIAINAANAGIAGPYFWVPTPVTVPGTQATLGAAITYDATIINDNVSTFLGPINISDPVLLDSINVTEAGNNTQQQREIGEFAKCVNYFGRGFYIGERVKTDNFVNVTFDGGTVSGLPAGWTVSPKLAYDISVVPSPIVNTSLYIKNIATPKIVQAVSYSATAASTITAAFGVSPTPGNTIVFLLTGHNQVGGYPSQTGLITQTNKTGAYWNSAIYTRTVQAGDSASWTLSLGGTQTGFSTLAMYELPGTPVVTAASGEITSGSITTNVITPTGTSIVLANFIIDNGTYAETVKLSPTIYYVDQIESTYSFNANVYTVTGSGASLPTSAITLTATPWTPVLNPVWTTILCSYGPTGVTINPTGTTLPNMLVLSQGAALDAYSEAIIQSNTAYSVRVTASIPSGKTSGSLVVELYSPSLDANWPFTIPFASMSTSVKEFTATFSNPQWLPVPSDLQLRVYPLNMAVVTDVLVDRIEIYPTTQPVYAQQCAVSYAESYEAVDSITGVIDTSNFTAEPQTDIFVFLETLYIKTATKTFAIAAANQSGEPSSWEIREVSNTIGECGPLASDLGEEYSLDACGLGVFLFDGGNHIKISQEVQSIWNAIYKPALNTIWLRNDITNKRIMVGIPLPTPNQWLPNAPVNATPTSPNVILMCSYLGLDTGLQIAEGPSIVVSAFAGHLIFKEGHRKWTLWTIPSPLGNFIPRPDGSTQFWFGGNFNGEIYELDPTNTTDNGAAIPETYCTNGFSDKITNETLQLGDVRKLYQYGLAKIEGSGQWNVNFYPETLATPYMATQAAFNLYNPALDDTNFPIAQNGNAMFIEFTVDGNVGSWFQLERLVIFVCRDPWLPISGV